eukprot:11871058-Heterocapsa_arctica.AAC.1
MCKDGEFYIRVPPAYWTELLAEVGLDKCKTVATPGDATADKDADETSLGSRSLAAPTCGDWAK